MTVEVNIAGRTGDVAGQMQDASLAMVVAILQGVQISVSAVNVATVVAQPHRALAGSEIKSLGDLDAPWVRFHVPCYLDEVSNASIL